MIWIEWIEPFGPNNEPVYMRVAPKTAIAVQRRIHPELTDEQALEEFIAVNWASKVIFPGPPRNLYESDEYDEQR